MFNTLIIITTIGIVLYYFRKVYTLLMAEEAIFETNKAKLNKFIFIILTSVVCCFGLLLISNRTSQETAYTEKTSAIKTNSLNSSNYTKIQPDFIFKGMNSLNSVSKFYDLMCSDESYDFYCIESAYKKIGNSQKTKDKYLGKIIKTPFMVASYRNDKNTVYLSDRGYISEYQRQEEASSCHLVDKENISQYIAETGNKQGDVEVIGVLKEISTINGRLVLDPCYYIKKHNPNSTSSSSKTFYNTPKIPSKLVLDISKPVYEKNENISLLAQWTGADVDCKILEEKVKETLDNRHFEIVDNSISCAGNDNKSLIQLRVQFKSPRIGKLNIPAITLENNISSNSVDFSVRDLEALQNAVVSKNIESIKAFLSSPADLDAIKIDGEHPVAHFIKDDMALAQELIKLGASPDVIDKNGYTPLMYAVIRQNNEFLDLLLDKNAYLNELDKKGRTAIMYAAIKNNIYAAKKLVKHKADIYKSKDGKWTAYQYAKEMKHTEIANLLKSPLNEILIIFDGCSSCEKKIKSLEKIVKQQYPIMNISYIRYTHRDGSNKYDHFPDQNYPIIKLKRQKDSDDFGSNSGNILGNWDGTEKQLEKIMYKEL